MRNFIFLAVGLLLFSSCATNPVKDYWVDPEEQMPLIFEKTLVIVIMTTPADRRVAEDEWVRQLPVIMGESSYPIIGDAELEKLQYAKAVGSGAGYKHALIMRFVGTKQELVYRPHSSSIIWNRGSWSYYDGLVPVYGGGSETQERTTFELSLYSSSDGRIIWTGNGELINPREVAVSVQKLAAGLAKRWEEQGILPVKKK